MYHDNFSWSWHFHHRSALMEIKSWLSLMGCMNLHCEQKRNPPQHHFVFLHTPFSDGILFHKSAQQSTLNILLTWNNICQKCNLILMFSLWKTFVWAGPLGCLLISLSGIYTRKFELFFNSLSSVLLEILPWLALKGVFCGKAVKVAHFLQITVNIEMTTSALVMMIIFKVG